MSKQIKYRYNDALLTLGLGSFFLFEYFNLTMFNVLQPYIVEEFSLSATKAGYLGATYFYAMVLMLIPAGLLIDKLPLKKTIIFNTLMGAIGIMLFGLANSYAQLVITRIFVGLSLGAFALISCIKCVSSFAKTTPAHNIVNRVIFIGLCGGILSQAPLAKLADFLGWRQACICIGLFGLSLTCILAAMLYTQTGVDSPSSKQKIDFAALNKFWDIGIVAGVLSCPVFLFGSVFGVAFLNTHLNVPYNVGASITTYIYWGMLSGCAILTLLKDKLAYGKVLITGIISVISAIVFVQYFLPSNTVLLSSAFYVLGLGSSMQVVSYSYIQKRAEFDKLGFIEGVHAEMIIGGGALVNSLVGILLDIVGANAYALVISSLLVLLGVSLLLTIRIFKKPIDILQPQIAT